MSKYTRDIIAKTKKFKGKVDVIAETIRFDKRINLTCRNDALDLIFLIDNDWNVAIDEPMDALRRSIEAMPDDGKTE